jgi:hypothetical protein
MSGCLLLEDRLRRVLADYGLTLERAFESWVDGDCVIDFSDKDYAEYLKGECEMLCDYMMLEEGEEAFESCIEECEETIDNATAGSIKIDPVTRIVKESTIPISCDRVFNPNIRDEEKQPWVKLRKRLIDAGCEVEQEVTDWIHQHEFIRYHIGGFEPEEEPTICYIHPRNCHVEEMLRAVFRRKQQ